MVFSSSIFMFMFLPITLCIYYLLAEKWRNSWILLASFGFFAFAQPEYLWLLILCILINFLGGILISRSNKSKTVWIILIILNLAVLILYKYSDFILTTVNHLFKTNFPLLKLTLPIGISFFTFMGVSYITDIYKGKIPAERNFIHYALYIAFFPHLTSGPIILYKDTINEIRNRQFDLDLFVSGVERFIIGLGKKALIADTMAKMVNGIWNLGAGKVLVETAWLGSIAYTLQIFFDFSGYSDMAIGLGRMFGFRFKENFNQPYISRNISEFWRRWHISLSNWFREYLYIPLGGNRKHVYWNLAVVYFVTGIWHGAAWNFIIWGILNGVFVLAERFCKKNTLFSFRVPDFIKHIYTLLIVNFGWVFFRADSLKNALRFIRNMLLKAGPLKEYTLSFFINRWTGLMLLSAIFFSTSLPKRLAIFFENLFSEKAYRFGKHILLALLFIFSIFSVVSGTYNSFIYFQF